MGGEVVSALEPWNKRQRCKVVVKAGEWGAPGKSGPRKGYCWDHAGGEIVVAIGGCRHSSDATAVGNRKQNTWVRGVSFFRSVQGRLEVEKGPGHP